jgi:hypothetical protein
MEALVRFAITMLLLLNANAASSADLLSYQAPGWKYKQVAWNDPLASTFYTTAFDDGNWSLSRAAFGNFGELNAPPPFCSGAYTIHTQWDVATDLLLRPLLLGWHD